MHDLLPDLERSQYFSYPVSFGSSIIGGAVGIRIVTLDGDDEPCIDRVRARLLSEAQSSELSIFPVGGYVLRRLKETTMFLLRAIDDDCIHFSQKFTFQRGDVSCQSTDNF